MTGDGLRIEQEPTDGGMTLRFYGGATHPGEWQRVSDALHGGLSRDYRHIVLDFTGVTRATMTCGLLLADGLREIRRRGADVSVYISEAVRAAVPVRFQRNVEPYIKEKPGGFV
jgi:hypothetical protein